jgi:hypothetical protein
MPEWLDELKSGKEFTCTVEYDPPEAFAEFLRKWREEMWGQDKWCIGDTMTFSDFNMRGTIIDRKIRDDGLVGAVRVQFERGPVWITFTEEVAQ